MELKEIIQELNLEVIYESQKYNFILEQLNII